MKKVFKKRCVFSLIVVVVILGAIIGITNAVSSETTVFENIAGVIITPIQKVFNDTANGVKGFFGYFSDVGKLKEENKKLKEENEKLSNQVKQTVSIQNENDELRKLIGLKENNPELELEAAEIVARDPSNWYNTITINKGSADGIAINQAVITKGNSLVGRVVEVGSTWARVITVIDSEHGAGVEILRSGDFGIIEGDSSLAVDGNCRLSLISKNSDVVVGDTIATSGLGGIYPKGIAIGSVLEIHPDIQGISQYAVVKPEANIKNLHMVYIIKSES